MRRFICLKGADILSDKIFGRGWKILAQPKAREGHRGRVDGQVDLVADEHRECLFVAVLRNSSPRNRGESLYRLSLDVILAVAFGAHIVPVQSRPVVDVEVVASHSLLRR